MREGIERIYGQIVAFTLRFAWGWHYSITLKPVTNKALSPFFRVSVCYPLRLMLPVCQPLPVILKASPFAGAE
jgi:hypothetical protein